MTLKQAKKDKPGKIKLKGENMFYDSNHDKHFIPEEKGWYVQYKTHSGDEGAIRVPSKPWNSDHALEMLKGINPDEMWDVQFYQEVK